MKSFFYLFFSLVLFVGAISITNAQPNYTLTAKNFIANSTTQFQFDIYLSRTGGGSEPYVKGQFALIYNSAILPVGGVLSMAYVAGSSGLPTANQSTTCITYVGGAAGYALYMTAPLDNTGTPIPDAPAEVRVGTYRVSNTLPFVNLPVNAAWRFATPNPFTKIWYYTAAKTSVQLSNSNINYVVIGGEMIAPVELSSLVAIADGRDVRIEWQTKTEVNSSLFQVERTLVKPNTDKIWSKVGEVRASGNSNSPKDYSFVDQKLNSGKYSYRLKMIDNFGKIEYSKEVEGEVALPKEYSISQNYPNPFNPTTRIDYQLPFDSRVTVELFIITGEKVATIVNNELMAGYYTVEVNSSALNLASGVYIYRISAHGLNANIQPFVQVKKLLLTK